MKPEENEVVGVRIARYKRATEIVALASQWADDQRSAAIMEAAQTLVRLGLGDWKLQSPVTTSGTVTKWRHRSQSQEIVYDLNTGVANVPAQLFNGRKASAITLSPLLELTEYSAVAKSATALIAHKLAGSTLDCNKVNEVRWCYTHPDGDQKRCVYFSDTNEWEGLDLAALALRDQLHNVLQPVFGLAAEAVLTHTLPDGEAYTSIRISAQKLVDWELPGYTFTGIEKLKRVVWTHGIDDKVLYYNPVKKVFEDESGSGQMLLQPICLVAANAIVLARHVIAEWMQANGSEVPEPDIVLRAHRTLRIADVQEADDHIF